MWFGGGILFLRRKEKGGSLARSERLWSSSSSILMSRADVIAIVIVSYGATSNPMPSQLSDMQ